MNKQIITLKDYLKYYGSLEIRDKDKLFYSNGLNKIGGIVRVKDIKRIGLI